MSLDRWILQLFDLNTSIPTCWMQLIPWHPFSSPVGCLMSVNGIHQWLVIRQWSIMFDFNTFICVMGHVLVMICVEDLQVWWHSIYATSLIVPVFMRCHLSWSYSNVLSDIFIHYGDLDLLYIVRGDYHTWNLYIMPIHGHCTLMYPGLLYVYLQSYLEIYHCIVLMSGWFFHLGLHYSTSGMDIMYFGHHVTPLTSHIRGHLL